MSDTLCGMEWRSARCGSVRRSLDKRLALGRVGVGVISDPVTAALCRRFGISGDTGSGRHGITGAHGRGHIGFSAIRGGDIAGEHDVIFAAPGERIVLRHIATDRSIFARGALKAALWGQNRDPGLYSMVDVLGL